MASDLIEFIFGFNRIDTRADAAIRYLENPAVARERAAIFTRRLIQGYFKKQSGPGGIQWAPISASWKRQKQRMGFSTQILVMRGDLAGSIESEIRGREIETYTDVPYAPRLHGGDPATNLPARPFMDVGSEDRGVAGDIYLDELEGIWA